MYPELLYEHVIYQNPFLAMRIWQIDSDNLASEETRRRTEQDWRQSRYSGWHYHEEVELLLILKGELTAFCKEEQLQLRKGDIAVFGSSEPHTTLQTRSSSVSYIVLQINLRNYWDPSTLNSMQHFSEVLRPLSSLNYIYRENKDARLQTAALIREIYREMNDAKIGYELAVSSRIKSILLLLLRHDVRSRLQYNHNDRLAERLQPAIDYVEAHLSDKLSVTEVSGLVNMSYTHFIKMFKRSIGMSFTDFVVYRRIKKAEQQLLVNDEASISEIAEAAGFSNLGHFYEMFRRLNGCSPKQFRDRMRRHDPLE
ncbi:AraC family transcriptional regulator [Cohnella lubricantis]|uniref:Helix-turn-helix domain-containing protein n=1 Tax=Cohnella lubricantis TaxID=2163172 RepID=A0A841TEN8_9BACL|nr:AraC family transcriptional regulator [Cohnella lubricantis]MBB6677447.1 helix-turn-helix domain-containing protein [Cohnella lubricantis]MBP2116667.1 AraC-like DNA-binding protein/mannose-6-phosphate isomerase-like protein (cupin superfamily) [Cohnella lubricantis]